jgi:Uncharacterized protein conserved in bacteria
MSSLLQRVLRLASAAGMFFSLAAFSAHAEFPERPITLIVPSAAGGTPDTLMRFLAQKAQERHNHTFVVENRPGGSGIPGITAVYRAAPDGYTIGYANNVTLAINRTAFKELPYDPQTLVPVAFVMKVANVLAVNPSLPIKTFDDFIAYAKDNPGKVTFASPGQGTSGHLTGELLAATSGIKLLHIPYRGSPQATTDVIAGTVDALFDNTTSISPHIRAGKLRALAVTSLQRSPSFPDLPTVAESRLPGFEGVAWGGLVAPPGTPKDVADKLTAMFNGLLDDPEIRQQLIKLGTDEVIGGPPQAMMDYAAKETEKWGKVIKESGVQFQ